MTSQLAADQSLTPEQRITASNGRAFLVMQGDGNLVLYEVFRGRHLPVWASNTDGRGGVKAVMQGDGNFVVYNASNSPLWDSGTWGNAGARLVMQDDGNAVVYARDGRPLWASHTWRRSRKLNFDPARHGFLFDNNFINQVANVPGFGNYTTQGRCGGMAFAALDYYLSGVPVPQHTPGLFGSSGVPPDGHWLADYIYARLMSSFATLASAKFVHWTLASDHTTTFGGKGVTRWTKEDEFPRLRERIDAGQPVALGLVDATSLPQVGSENHQVLAYGYEWHPRAGTMVVYVYDNNTPGREVVLSSTPDNPHFDASNTDPWRGFFVNDYARTSPPVYTRRPPAAAAVVSYGQTVKLSHVWTGRTLHSHALNYGHSGTSGQQQVTCFEGADDNDLWRIKGPHGSAADHKVGQPVNHGDIVRLEHVLTRRNLHSHSGHPSPVTRQQEVTCFGQNGAGDGNDDWRVEVDGRGQWGAQRRVRLIHRNTNHALHSHLGHKDPRWTAGQQEVTGFGGRDENDWWWLLEVR